MLRTIVRRRISERAATARKRGFTVPVEAWMATQWRESVKRSFEDSVLDAEGWIRADAVIRTLDAESRSGRVSTRLWYLYILEEWMKAERAAAPASSVPQRPAAS